jgi:hypothetical protein
VFKIPKNVADLSIEDLKKALADARAESLGYAEIADEDFTDKDLEALEALAAFISEAEAQETALAAAGTERKDRIAAARAAVAAPAEEEAPAEEPTAEVEEVEEEVVDEKEAVAASARPAPTRSALQRAAAAQPPVEAEPERTPATIVASADVPGVALGQALSMEDLAKAAIRRFERMPKGLVGPRRRDAYGLADIMKTRTDGLTDSNREYKTTQDLIEAAGSESRLTGNSLVAAGGWCAPNETLYDLVTEESTDGLWDVPEVGVTRGGISFTKGPDFSDFYEDYAGWWYTEAQVIADTEKPCFEVECPPFQDVTLDAVGVCISAGILTNAAYPELVRRYIEGTLIAHQHRVSGTLLTRAATIAGAAVSVVNAFANAPSILTALELVALGEKQRKRLPMNTTMEVVLPFWAKAAIRADLANRTGVDMLAVTDQQIDSYFGVRQLRVQYVYNWNPLVGSSAGVGPVLDFPATVNALVYPAGTFVKLTKDLITLNAIYDSTNIKTNTYTALFAEEGVALANRRGTARHLTIPLNVTGRTGAADINDDWGTAQA